MLLVLQLHLVMMRKYSKFDVDTFNTFWVMGATLKFLHEDEDNNDNDVLEINQNSSIFFFETDKLNSWTLVIHGQWLSLGEGFTG